MRAVIIDPVNRSIYEKDLPNAEIDTIYAEIGVKGFDIGRLGSGVSAFVDDLGLRRKDQRYWYFDHPGGRVLMAGKAVILSVDDHGETVDLDSRATLESFLSLVTFAGTARDAENLIQLGLLQRPEIRLNGEPIWQWTPAEETLDMGAAG